MLLKKITLNNIRSYENESIEFPLGSTVMAGDIGSGKTSVLLAIEFALFGLQPGQKGAGLLRNGKEEASVTLEIEIDGKKVIIERGLKKAKSVNQSYASLDVDGLKQEMSVTELKNRVLELLNYPGEFAKKTNVLYRFTVYTPQEEMKQIILESPETRLDTLRHIFGIDKYKRIRENAENFASKLREEIRGFEGQIKDLEEIKNKLEEKKESVKILELNIEKLKLELIEKNRERKQAEEAIKDVEEKIKEKEKYEREADKTRIMLMGKQESLSNIEKDIIVLKKQIEEAKKIQFNPEELEKIEVEIKTIDKEIEDKNKLYIEVLSKTNSLQSKILELEKSKSDISPLHLCPTCFQNVPEDYKANIKRKFEEDIQKSKKEIENLKQSKIDYAKSLDDLKLKQNSLKRTAEDLKLLRVRLENTKEKESRLIEFDIKKEQAKKDISLLEKQIETLKEYASLLKKFDLIYSQKKNELDEARTRERAKDIELASAAKEKEMTLRLIEDIKKDIEKKENLKQKLIEISELEDWLSSSFIEIISFTERNIMLKLREEFSKLFNEWFNILVPEIFTVHLDEDFTPIIEQKDYQLEYSYLSGGERTAIALAYRLALNQVINSLLSKIKTHDIIILDEPTDGFSEQQLDKMRDVLSQLKVQQLLIVSHESKIESFVENIIRFKKIDGITKVAG